MLEKNVFHIYLTDRKIYLKGNFPCFMEILDIYCRKIFFALSSKGKYKLTNECDKSINTVKHL